MEIRRARGEDAAAICAVVRRSIAELCAADHRDDPALLAAWLEGKTPQTVERWIANPDNQTFVAVERGQVLAAGCVTGMGEVILNYVSPDARFRGVSRALLAAMEAHARELGCREVKLSSTATALRFYLAAGYVEAGAACSKHGIGCHPLRKAL